MNAKSEKKEASEKRMTEFQEKFRTVIDKNGRIHFVPINNNKPTQKEVEKGQWGLVVFILVLIAVLLFFLS